MEATTPDIPLSRVIPPLILGGAGFSYQLTSNPNPTQTREVISRAFELGLRAIDTSAYYEPSEQLLGEALSHPEITSRYQREDYFLMSKVGRISASQFDYSPQWIRYSISRSLQRLRTGYLDVVFCHDIEFVPEEQVVEVIGVLLEMVATGAVRYIGVSGYRIDVLSKVARRVRETYGRSLDVVQTWAQMTLQNDRLEREGLQAFKEAGVGSVCSSSPLAIGLLRDGGVPIGTLGDFHPAPPGLRKAAQDAALYVASQGDSLASLALRHALRRAQCVSTPGFRVSTIMGGTSVAEIENNIATSLQVLRIERGAWQWNPDGETALGDAATSAELDKGLCTEVQQILGEWMNYSFSVPGDNWDVQTGRPMIQTKL
ncbi:hypothetical protein P175DRAFT_0500883 [Aspergillus ochraceoroseus IBT 24754]|uniref:NADP-dependent oxidoreductase domain-containing protein n=2 Tax=Aspergillus ochraceoroseus TaxID=138278 RepID=A0A2T5M0H3_9EURO|nr:uncharacterized protein P175DRAFT_0500883 [Aspergillus ochraceoroseus IBT 24754]KKK18901.1 hypothetical protein AOCH_000303 [Aspergillus ochraceoroseus]PTU22028.1 hypothetical protein P175DRAFT_0500883 [Aspergillus ochraceoroseus IBT 24754]